jgi:hypothetical protein
MIDLVFHVSPSRGLPADAGAAAAADDEDAEAPREDIEPGTTIRLLPSFGDLPEGVDSPVLNMTEQSATVRVSGLRILELTPEGHDAFGFSPPYAAVHDGTTYATTGVLQRRYAGALAAAAARGGPVVQAMRLEYPKQPPRE